MNLKKSLLSISMVILMVLITLIPSIAFAANELYLGITELNDNNWGYAIGDPDTNGTTGNAHKIWNILEYVSSEDGAALKADGNKNIYCVNAGIGFSDTKKRATYNVFYDMKTERERIKAQNDVLKALVEGNIPGNDSNTTVSKYDALLALSDMLYLSGDSEGQKMALLEAAGIKYSDTEEVYYNVNDNTYTWDVLITDDDIRAVQQAAIWYFTNYYEVDTSSEKYAETTTHSTKYDKTTSTGWLNYTLDGTNYDNLSDYNTATGEGSDREQQAEILYNYLIKAAKANANNYSTSSATGVPAQVSTQTLQYEELDSNYVVGPIKITENEGNATPYTIDFDVKVNGAETENYKLLKSDKTDVTTGTTIKDLVGQDFYISVPKDSTTSVTVSATINYSSTKLTLWTSATNGNGTQPVMIPEKSTTSVPWEKTVTPNSKSFDLALRKYITKIEKTDGTEVSYSRTPNIDESTIASSTSTATYKHRKDPVSIETGDIVTYKLTIYNEGQKDGRATKVVDQLPTGLKFSKVVSGNFELGSYDETNNTVNLVRKASNTTNLPAYEEGSLTSGRGSETIEIECEVIATPDETNTKILTNVAWISEEIDADGNVITNLKGLDIDSEPSTKPDVNKDNMESYAGDNNKSDLSDNNYYYKGQQDDDDFEKLILMPESFDLKLIKRITAVNNQNVTERIEKVDVSKLNTIGEDGKLITTAEYELNKTPVSVKRGDIVTYTFRIYNEGTIDGYATEITEDIPEGLEYLWDDGIEYNTDGSINWDKVTKEFTDEEKEAIEFNFNNGWSYAGDSTLKTIKTDYLSRDNETIPGDGSNLIKAFGNNDGTKTESDISYKEVSVKLKVISEDVTGTTIRNEACISEDTNKNGDPVDDRDSNTENWVKYEDDEDYDNIILKAFDLALRKFIIAVSDDTEIENGEYLKDDNGLYTRAPTVDTSKLNTTGEDGKLITTAIYNHTKEPVMVQKDDIVVYMLRVYNEGEIGGYAAEIKDHLPPHLEFVEGKFNEEYGWEVSEDGRTVATDYLKDKKIDAAEWIPQRTGMTNESDLYKLTYKEVPIMCRVKDSAKSDENITNIADITEYLDENKESVNDRDSQEDNVVLPEDDKLPTYKDDENGEYIPGQQDDDDFEKLIVKEFDLALRKWVTQAIVIDSNGQTITETGHQPYDDPEQVVKVEIHRKKVNQVTVKFRYSIRVINEGDIAGYAKEVTDYVPQGLKFVAEDNKGWTDEGNNVISTRLLENTLLQPGEYADVEVVLTWVNSQDNMGVMINTAEISEDYNDYGVPDRDSTPDNQKPGEDDIDDAPVMLTISTGQMRIYFTLGFVVLITIAGGIVLIKKYVL